MCERTCRDAAIQYRRDLGYFFQNRLFLGAVLITAVISYGYSFTSIAIGRDSLEGARYLGDGNVMLTTGRFGMNLWATVLAYGEASPAYQFCIDFLAAGLLVLAAIQLCVVFRRVCAERISMFGYGAFSCLMISYPLMNEIWEYTGANACVCGGFFLDAVCLYLVLLAMDTPSVSGRMRVACLLAATVAMGIVCSSYESLAVVYVFLVFTVLSMQLVTQQIQTFRQLLQRGLVYAAVLVGGIFLRFATQFVICQVFQFHPSQLNGATSILWNTAPFVVMLKDLVKQCIIHYGMRGCFYFPIGALVLSGAVFLLLTVWLVCRCRRPLLLIPAAGMYVCLVMLSLLQGVRAPYRTCQVFAVMVAITGLGAFEAIRRFRVPRLLTLAAQVFLVLLCLNQATYLSHLLVLDSIRSEEEAYTVRTIGTDLERHCDLSKPVVFIGNYTLSQDLTDAVSVNTADCPLYHWFQTKTQWETEPTVKYVETNVNSVIDWALYAFHENAEYGVAMENLFRYYGFDLSTASRLQDYQAAWAYSEGHDLPAYPQYGYIIEQEDFIIVNLQ